MTDRNDNEKRSEIDRLYNRYSKDFSEIDLEAVPEKTTRPVDNDIVSDDDLFDASTGDYELDDADDTESVNEAIPRAELPTKETSPSKQSPEPGREPIRKRDIVRPLKKTVDPTAPYSHLPSSASSASVKFLPALLPILIWAVFVYGIRVVAISAVSVISCVIFELWFEYIIRKRVTVNDLSAVSDGLLISLLMPPSVPYWIPVVAAFFGTVIIKCLFGGRGKSLLQPSLAGFVFVLLIFGDTVTVFTRPLARLPLSLSAGSLAELSASYPLSEVSGQALNDFSYIDLFLGLRAGSIGEISVLLIAAALVYLLVRRVISWHIPVGFIAVSGILFYLFPRNAVIGKFTVIELLCGIIPLAAIFFASDFTVAPIFPAGKLVFGAGCGALTVLFRYLGLGIHSALYAVLIMDLLSRPLDAIFMPRPKIKKIS